MRVIYFLLLSVSVPLSAFSMAGYQSYHSEGTKVFYFGGYAATAQQMRCWESGAQKNSPGGYAFEGIQYPPGAGADAASAIQLGAAYIRRVVDEINANPERRYVVAGHSSGAALSNRVAELVRNPRQVSLVSLDGFTPSRNLQSRLDTSCWYSVNQTGLMSRNAGAMIGNCVNHPAFQDYHCRTQWCLHFVLAVKSTPANLGGDFRTRGYDGCDTNLDWLP